MTPVARGVSRAAGMQTEATYINHRYGMGAQWVTLRPIFEVCAHDTGFKGGRRRRKPWWRQYAPDEVIRATLVEASREAWPRQRRWGNPNGATDSGGGRDWCRWATSRWTGDPMKAKVWRG